MTDTRFHLAWFMNFTPDEWREPFAQGGFPWDGQFYVEMAQTLERACFDYIMIEDKLMVPETFGGNRDYALSAAMVAPFGHYRHPVDHGLSTLPAGAPLLNHR